MSGKPVYCDDWSCPSGISCALHFGRSKEYAGMVMPPPETRARDRQGRDYCPEYKRDRPKKWLVVTGGIYRGMKPNHDHETGWYTGA